MPIYEYKCTKCNQQFEIMQKISDEPLTQCSSCGGEVKKLITNTSFVLKGSGWYVTDYPSDDRKKATEAKKSTACSGGTCDKKVCDSKKAVNE
ncbi:MAG: zinc ribbon domain-containing protein [Nitrospiraceae bacterium]|nr:MAG: zinc ribbon domain-containing protein [Nitrospiraceae bacterium]